MRAAHRPWIFGGVLLLAGVGWFVDPRGEVRAARAVDGAASAATTSSASSPAATSAGPPVLDGEVTRVEDAAVWLAAEAPTGAGGRFPIAPVLAAQLHPGDRIHAELAAGERIERLRFLTRAPAAPAPRSGPPGSLAIGEQLPSLVVPTITGPITLGADQGTPTVLAFLFTSCGIPTACPLVSQKLEQLQGAVRGHGRIVAITLDPDVDTLPVLRAYAGVHHVDGAAWKLGRLELDQLEPLLAKAGVGRVRQHGQIFHGLDVLLLDGQGRLAWRSQGSQWLPATLAERLRALP
ncbi:MAG TPA: SCO family protein [Kofleriaceae bacterium]|nr:SCO family protein [Kofleriaceae bacterium]